MKTVAYNLKETVKIASKGKEVEAFSLEIYAPRNQVFSDVNIIKHYFIKAQKTAEKNATEMFKFLSKEQFESMQKNAGEQKVEAVDPADVFDVLAGGISKEELDMCIMALRDILSGGNLTNPMCLVDNTKMTKPIFDDLSYNDTCNILGLYITSFLDTHRKA